MIVEADSASTRSVQASAVHSWTNMGVMFLGQSKWGPALAEHNGRLCCLFANRNDGDRLYYAWGSNTFWVEKEIPKYWTSPMVFAGGPVTRNRAAMAYTGDVLHAVVVETADGQPDLVHYQYDDLSGRWGKRCGVVEHCGAFAAIAGLNGQLFCAFSPAGSSSHLGYTIWNPVDGWSPVKWINEWCLFGPALYQMDSVLHLLFAQTNDGKVVDLTYNESADNWARSPAQPSEAADNGVSATAIPGQAYLGFLKRNGSGLVLVSSYANGKWYPNDDIGNQWSGAWSGDAPGLAVQDDYVACAWPDQHANGNLTWARTQVSGGFYLDTWMSKITGNTPLPFLSIPGTHDTCAISDTPYVGAQYMSVPEQLNAGIRFLDLRCGLNANVLYMFHGPYPLLDSSYKWIKFSDVLGQIYSWLDAHSSEAIVVSIKEDPDPVNSTIGFDAAVYGLINNSRWYLKDDHPFLSAVRNKLVLMRRYSASGDNAVGIDASQGWRDNNKSAFNFTTPGGTEFTVQDYYSIDGKSSLQQIVDTKWGAVSGLLSTSIDQNNSYLWYINFASAVAAPDLSGSYPATPYQIATGTQLGWKFTPGINSRLHSWFTTKKPPKRWGVIVMDFPELPNGDLITSIVTANTFTS